MKRIVSWTCAVFLLVLAFTAINSPPAYSAGNVNMAINGSIVDFQGQEPFIDSATGRTMIPLRMVAEKMGAQVSWDGIDTALITKDGLTISMKVGSNAPLVNGSVKYLDAPAKLVNGRTMVPVRFISEAMGCQVEWNANTGCVNIITNGNVVPAPPIPNPPESAPYIPNPSRQLVTPRGMLPNEENIQKSLTQEDFARLRSYTIRGAKVQKDLDIAPPELAATYTFNFDTFNPDRRQIYFNAVNIVNNGFTFDYTKFTSQAYTDEFTENNFKVGNYSASELANFKKYVTNKVASKLQIKTYLLTDKFLLYQASPKYTAIRVMYIFYQSNGTKLEEPGSSIGKWYKQDIDLLFVTPLGTPPGNTTGVIYVGMQPLSAPQPYFK